MAERDVMQPGSGSVLPQPEIWKGIAGRDTLLGLFSHNQRAYDAVCRLLTREGKAAVIHPTGTGKAFIAFRLVLDNPQARVLWLSPSGYIFRTQLENLRKRDRKSVV